MPFLIIIILLVLPLSAPAQDRGKTLYDQWCAQCHGEKGDGKGPAADFVFPKPRDFTKGTYKFSSTGSGEPPLDADIVKTIRDGNPGTSMPGWKRFSDADMNALVKYLKQFSADTFSIAGTQIKIAKPSGSAAKLIALGKEQYQRVKCWECHGQQGRGDGKKGWQDKFRDDWGSRIYPADQTHPWEYRRGSDLKDIFITISAGINGTPMTSYGDTVSEENRWALAYYVQSEHLKRNPGLTLAVKKVKSIPASTDDPAWEKVPYLDLPLGGQLMFDPRDFMTLLTDARVRGVYTGTDLAVMLEWTDKQPNKGDDGNPPDAARIQFPAKQSAPEKPYFFTGGPKLKVNIWQWKASDNNVVELNGEGPDKLAQQDVQDVKVVSTYTDGLYRVMFTRKLATGDENDTVFGTGSFIPFAVALYDGRDGEADKKGAISAWYYLVLEPPTPVSVYIVPVVVFLVVLGIGILIHRSVRKQRRAG